MFPIQWWHVAGLESCVMWLIPGLWKEEMRTECHNNVVKGTHGFAQVNVTFLFFFNWKQKQAACKHLLHECEKEKNIESLCFFCFVFFPPSYCVYLGQPPWLPLFGHYGRQCASVGDGKCRHGGDCGGDLRSRYHQVQLGQLCRITPHVPPGEGLCYMLHIQEFRVVWVMFTLAVPCWNWTYTH